MPKIEYEPFEKYPEVKGVFVGGCARRGDGSSFRARAHAHCFGNDEFAGWICVRSPKRLYAPSDKPSKTMLHELAHILTKQGHTKKWAMMLKELGGTISWYAKYKGVRKGIHAFKKKTD